MMMVLKSPESRARPKGGVQRGQSLAYSEGEFCFRHSCFRQNKLPLEVVSSPSLEILVGFVPGDAMKHQVQFSYQPLLG